MENITVTLAEGIVASDSILKNLSAALAQAQGEYEEARKAAENKFEGFKYVDLEGLLKAVRPSLTKHKIAVLQFHSTDLMEKSVSVYTRLIHWESGEWIQHFITLPAEGVAGKDGPPKFNQKTIGAAVTYGRKYSLKTIVGIADSSDEDVDKEPGNADLSRRTTKPAIKPSPAMAPAAAETPLPASVLSSKDRKLLFDECYRLGGNNDVILQAIHKVTGQDSSKLVRYADVEKIKAEVYKLANPDSGVDPLLADAVGEGEVIP